MSTPRERVEIEYGEVKDRYNSLQAFIGGQVWRALPIFQQHLLALQCTFMLGYLQVLAQRLEEWGE